MKIKEIISKLRNYSDTYKSEGNLKFSDATKQIANYLENDDYENAITLFRTSELHYDIGNTYDELKRLASDKYIEEKFDVNWGLKAGEYIVWRSGNIENQKNGMFFSISKEGAEAYSNNEREAKKYKVIIKNPLIANRAEEAYLKLTGRKVPETLQQSGRKEDWWVRLDTKIVSLAKTKGYDSVTYIKPAPPALRELILFDNKNIVEITNEEKYYEVGGFIKCHHCGSSEK